MGCGVGGGADGGGQVFQFLVVSIVPPCGGAAGISCLKLCQGYSAITPGEFTVGSTKTLLFEEGQGSSDHSPTP